MGAYLQDKNKEVAQALKNLKEVYRDKKQERTVTNVSRLWSFILLLSPPFCFNTFHCVQAGFHGLVGLIDSGVSF